MIEDVPAPLRSYFLAPLFAQCTERVNSLGYFQSFFKDRSGRGAFGGRTKCKFKQITGDMELQRPVFSNFECPYEIFRGDANNVAENPERHIDAVYIDAPYNEFAYGSAYFMLNVILDNKKPKSVSAVCGTPSDWQRSAYNKKRFAAEKLEELVEKVRSRYVIVSFSSDGFIADEDMRRMLSRHGGLTVLERSYPAFRPRAGLRARTTERLYVLKKKASADVARL